MSRGRALAALSVLTAEQWGMVTAAQARWLGVSRVDIGRLLADGALELVEGAALVYRLAGCPPDPELDPLRGAWLQLGNDRPAMLRLADPDAVTSHRSAANALGLGDVIAGAHEFYVTRRHQPRRRDLRLRGDRGQRAGRRRHPGRTRPAAARTPCHRPRPGAPQLPARCRRWSS